MLEVNIRITGDADNPLSEHELSILAVVGGGGSTTEIHNHAAPAPEPEKATTTKPAKAAPAKAAPAKTTAPKAEEPAAPAAAEENDETRMEEAVSRATQLINDGAADKLRSILAGLDVKRVSELTGDSLVKFLEETA